jgi:hypothetical protein
VKASLSRSTTPLPGAPWAGNTAEVKETAAASGSPTQSGSGPAWLGRRAAGLSGAGAEGVTGGGTRSTVTGGRGTSGTRIPTPGVMRDSRSPSGVPAGEVVRPWVGVLARGWAGVLAGG